MGKIINIAIDGPAGAGKSTISKQLASQLGYTYLDTGAMYRAVALYVLRMGKDVNNASEVESLLKDIQLDIKYIDGSLHIFLQGKDVSTDIREHHISKAASDVSKIHAVRLFLVDMQRLLANKTNSVLDGRDIGTFVLPNADYKFYLTADAKVRAQRRFDELQQKGETKPFEEILQDIESRDYNDSNRDFAPLRQAEDAIVIDSSYLSIQEVLNKFISYIAEAK